MVDKSRGSFFSRKKKSPEEKQKQKETQLVSEMESLAFLARQSIESRLKRFKNFDNYISKHFESDKPFKNIEKIWGKVSSGVCVTLYVDDELRGSYVNRIPNNSVYEDIIDYSIKAGFEDLRFPVITEKECKRMNIEIMLVDKKSYPVPHKDTTELLILLEKNKDKGLLVRKGRKEAYFLPDTWELIPNPSMFISSLCVNAGLPASSWKGEKRLWPQKITDRKRDLYTGKIIEPQEFSGIDINFLNVKGYQGDGKTFVSK
tara:strand:+ start:61 stop:840 length:780 start_codon:yes stop_codon:yes gene_type:complete